MKKKRIMRMMIIKITMKKKYQEPQYREPLSVRAFLISSLMKYY